MKTGCLEQRSNLVQQTQSDCERKVGDSKAPGAAQGPGVEGSIWPAHLAPHPQNFPVSEKIDP